MSTSAVLMMIVAVLVVWGGLVAAILHLRARPGLSEDEPPARPGPRGSHPDH
jgi:hypothetical protein